MILDFNSAKRLDQIEAERRTVDVEDIKARLNANPRGFVEWLFSGRAYCTAKEARIGDVHGTPGASLSIALSGPDTGLWHDHATGEGGDLIKLYQAYMGYRGNSNFQLALKEIASEFLGDPIRIERPSWQPSASARIDEKKQTLGTKPRDDMLQFGAPVATYRYQDLQGNQIASVVRFEPDGTRESKTFLPYCFHEENGRRVWKAGAPLRHRPLYRLPQIALASHVVLVEGEGKADALASLGIDATSAMQGSKAPLDKTDWTPLRGKDVTIWPDHDEPGHEYATKVAAHLISLGCTVRIVQVPPGKQPKWDAGDCVAEGEDVHGFLARAMPFAGAAKSRIRILDVDDLEDAPPVQWLIEGLVPEGGLIVVWGRSGDLKSWVALDQGMRIATGTPWFKLPTKKGLVLYIAAEGAHGFANRVMAWRRTKGALEDLPKPAFKLIPQSIALTSDDLEHLVAAVMTLGEQPVLIIVDTLARTFGAGDENRQADMNAYVNAADRLREELNTAVMIIHHSGVHEDKRERGSNVLRGAANTVIKVARKGEKIRIVNRSPEGKQKDAEELETINLRVRTVSYKDATDTTRTTLSILTDDDPLAEITGASKPRELNINEQRFLALLQRHQPRGFTSLTSDRNGPVSSSKYRETVESLLAAKLIKEAPESNARTKLWMLDIQPELSSEGSVEPISEPRGTN